LSGWSLAGHKSHKTLIPNSPNHAFGSPDIDFDFVEIHEIKKADNNNNSTHLKVS